MKTSSRVYFCKTIVYAFIYCITLSAAFIQPYCLSICPQYCITTHTITTDNKNLMTSLEPIASHLARFAATKSNTNIKPYRVIYCTKSENIKLPKLEICSLDICFYVITISSEVSCGQTSGKESVQIFLRYV